MSLTQYKQKRHFKQTPEPAGSTKKAKDRQLEFVVQKHNASHLHYDIRLEMDGVLKSWAVPKGPSMNPKDRRLAMMVEDHPWEYKNFEGQIPQGNYGAGDVIIWDRGTYETRKGSGDPEHQLLNQLQSGHITFIMHGQKLNGEFALVKNNKLEDNAWLLIKKDDEFASTQDITQKTESVKSGREVKSKRAKQFDLSAYPSYPMPTKIKPMLATLVKDGFDNPDWLYEIKWDGYRAIGTWDGKHTQLYSRNGLDFSERYAPVVIALAQLDHQVVLDGEVVALDKDGRSRFELLQNWMNKPQTNLAYVAFDLLWLDGHDLTDQPLLVRKDLLRQVIPGSSVIIYSDHIIGQGKQFFKAAQAQQLEGIIAKDSRSLYRQGNRSEQWLKIKAHLQQEVVIGGYTDPKGSRKYIGSLLVGVYDNKELNYVGHAGGLPLSQLESIYKQLKKLERKTSPFAQTNKIKPNAPAHWVAPELVCQVSFSEWTKDGKMRQPIFMGFRQDKPAKDVHKELPQTIKPKSSGSAKSNARVHFTHLDKVFFPESKITKGDLINYYHSIAPTIFPYLKDRPHSLLRQPNGINGESFFQKDVGHMPPQWVQTDAIYSESNKKKINYLVCNTTDTLMYMVQLGCIEINPWNSTVKTLDKPDWIVMDLDPEDISFDKVVQTAKAVHSVCEELNIPSYPKTSGKTGIHIFIPMAAKYSYDQSKQFGEILANLINQRVPDFTSLVRSPAKRQHKVYIDYLQNREGQTLAAPYSVRPTPVASVSTPLHWDEVNDKLEPANFTIKNTLKRLDQVGDLWQPVLGKGIDIKKILNNVK